MLPTIVLAIIGIVAGVSIVVSILYLQPSILDIFGQNERYAKVTIEGLQRTYKIGEPIDFVVRVEGYGCDLGFPHVFVKRLSFSSSSDSDETKEKILWSRFGEIRSFPAGTSCNPTNIYQARHIGDVEKYNNDEQEQLRIQGSMPIVIDREGRYAIHVEGGNVRGEPFVQEFEVK